MKELNTFSDSEIVSKIVSGERALFEILIRRYNGLLYKTGRSYHYNHEDTQDLMQDTFVDAFNHLQAFEHRSSFKTWIIKIMLHNCYRKRRKFSFKNEDTAEISDLSIPMYSTQKQTDTTAVVFNKELGQIIESALQHIPLDYRMVFSLREMSGLSVEETADALNISSSNVKVRLNRAKAMLRKEVERAYSTCDLFEFNLIYCDSIVERVMNRIRSKGL